MKNPYIRTEDSNIMGIGRELIKRKTMMEKHREAKNTDATDGLNYGRTDEIWLKVTYDILSLVLRILCKWKHL